MNTTRKDFKLYKNEMDDVLRLAMMELLLRNYILMVLY